MKKEVGFIGGQEASRVLGNISEACFGPWIPTKPPLHEALKPYVQDVGGVQFVPARLLNRVDSALNKPTTQK
ncbi:MAG: hypothetical protein HYW62_04700 [Candidatus Levybacteria bacterium]|nr:hypothetical protein [Candidatus Levybacteria bacterium]